MELDLGWGHFKNRNSEKQSRPYITIFGSSIRIEMVSKILEIKGFKLFLESRVNNSISYILYGITIYIIPYHMPYHHYTI